MRVFKVTVQGRENNDTYMVASLDDTYRPKDGGLVTMDIQAEAKVGEVVDLTTAEVLTVTGDGRGEERLKKVEEFRQWTVKRIGVWLHWQASKEGYTTSLEDFLKEEYEENGWEGTEATDMCPICGRWYWHGICAKHDADEVWTEVTSSEPEPEEESEPLYTIEEIQEAIDRELSK